MAGKNGCDGLDEDVSDASVALAFDGSVCVIKIGTVVATS
jgi:hypothetical protein